MLDRGQPLSLWGLWWNAILLLRPAFSRLRTFLWFATIVAGLTVRAELLGVTSIVRALNLRPRLYTTLLKNFHSSALVRRIGSSLIGCRPCGRRLCCGCSQIRCASMAGWSWSAMASRSPNAAAKCRP